MSEIRIHNIWQKKFSAETLPSGTIHYSTQTCFIKSQVSGSRINRSYCFIIKKKWMKQTEEMFLWRSVLSCHFHSFCKHLCHSSRCPLTKLSAFWCWCHAALLCSLLLLLLHSSPGNSRTEGSDSRCGTQVHAEPKRSQGISLRPLQTEPPTQDSLFTNMFGVSYLLVIFHLLLTVGEVRNNGCNLFTIILSK